MKTNTITINAGILNAISGTVAGPLMKTLWEMSDYNPDALKHFYFMLSGFFQQGRYSEAIELLCLLHDMACIKIPNTLSLIFSHTEACGNFLSELLLDVDEIIQEFIGE